MAALEQASTPPAPEPAPAPHDGRLLGRLLFVSALVLCLVWFSPPMALAVGMLFGLTLGSPWAAEGRRASKWLLQASVVLLGFGMPLGVVLRAGERGALFAAGTIATTLLLGWLLGKALGLRRDTSVLISTGTAICGGSAIAAVATVLDADESDVSVSIGTVFLLNAAALYLFPVLGHALHLSGDEFGTWAGVAIHDVSSVVAAAARYGGDALPIATAVKLSRALWIVPVTLGFSLFAKRNKDAGARGRQVRVPWFIGLFLVASLARSFVPVIAHAAPTLSHAALVGLTLTLFLVGPGLSRQALRAVGWRALVQGLSLWVFIGAGSLAVIRWLG